ncbi:hypothetical protein DM194_18260 (plasmid) [Azospirillum ramasamyi]|uniref:Uncharacterized protein n=1 Tax=Azospirillum ramasamyi TaxID=682998 RepID=A0A2U9SED7_9PROT|nr:hypothetical protein DM194_18260 [Azospirillum ramasamyi]
MTGWARSSARSGRTAAPSRTRWTAAESTAKADCNPIWTATAVPAAHAAEARPANEVISIQSECKFALGTVVRACSSGPCLPGCPSPRTGSRWRT